ncbi:3-deoxy-manno-octulosonate cytidylyltransferase [Pseudoruegeria sp. SHC-113]|uniref:3-deoxy-manno-octulosonate cytidylyltransferase n=1 Tax=Pseudoruegeria sp. SHC-113 TaxID=2855439 RepID=UPI0021BAF0DA|nr:manno-octulosonate cytidylyltransferase [Pseudoruegeria sp. SHC-113]MCT8160370.1 3-deoxy-manno-octulosonate cytidylyltransferase [Pseudoruegeria sp. SHC-113]
MKSVILIPARYASTRYPGKPLALLKGAGGEAKSLIQRSWDCACSVAGADAVYVVTDDDRIRAAAEGFGAKVLMTSSSCRNGTERCAEAVALLPETPEIVVNLQGDAPLTPPWFVEALIESMAADPGTDCATPVLRSNGAHLARLKADRKADRVGGTTAVFGRDNAALYFSKEVLPFTPGDYRAEAETPVFHHVGVYAYTPQALAAYAALAPGQAEELEGLEQLRFLENGMRVRCVEVEARGRDFWELNNPSDIDTIEGIMSREGIA